MIGRFGRVIVAAGALAALAAAGPAAAQGSPKVIRAAMQADLKVLDPIFTTANITAYHGAMVYDTLFGYDEHLVPQPQMVDKWTVSDDRLTYTFTLRDGLKWHDGAPVTSRDCVASLKRWAARDGAGQMLMSKAKALEVVDDKTFRLILNVPFGLVIDSLAKLATPIAFMMREKDAATDPNQQIKEVVGSGPFRFVASEWVPGSKIVYEKNPDYIPRKEPASGMAGGKVVKVDRVEWDVISDPQTAASALLNNEIDFYETPSTDMLPTLKASPDITVEAINPLGLQGLLRMNHLQPPFDNVKARQAMLMLINQEDYLQAAIGDPNYYKVCGALFGCGTPMESDVHTEWLHHHDVEKAKQLFKEAGYDGRPVVILQPTDYAWFSNAALVTAQALRSAGVNAQLAVSDWGGVVTRRANKAPVDQGGWNIFLTSAGTDAVQNPVSFVGMAANGEKGWFGWPSNAKHEELREKWANAATIEERKAIAREIQDNAYEFVLHGIWGQWVAPVAYRKNLSGFLKMPEVVAFWNVEKK